MAIALCIGITGATKEGAMTDITKYRNLRWVREKNILNDTIAYVLLGETTHVYRTATQDTSREETVRIVEIWREGRSWVASHGTQRWRTKLEAKNATILLASELDTYLTRKD